MKHIRTEHGFSEYFLRVDNLISGFFQGDVIAGITVALTVII